MGLKLGDLGHATTSASRLRRTPVVVGHDRLSKDSFRNESGEGWEPDNPRQSRQVGETMAASMGGINVAGSVGGIRGHADQSLLWVHWVRSSPAFATRSSPSPRWQFFSPVPNIFCNFPLFHKNTGQLATSFIIFIRIIWFSGNQVESWQ